MICRESIFSFVFLSCIQKSSRAALLSASPSRHRISELRRSRDHVRDDGINAMGNADEGEDEDEEVNELAAYSLNSHRIGKLMTHVRGRLAPVEQLCGQVESIHQHYSLIDPLTYLAPRIQALQKVGQLLSLIFFFFSKTSKLALIQFIL
jgi:hypothetical protein